MTRLPRILLATLTILSLLLSLASTSLWLRGYFRADALGWSRPHAPNRDAPFFELESAGGGIALTTGYYSRDMLLSPQIGGWFWHTPSATKPPPYALGRPANRLGFGTQSFRFAQFHGRRIVFPAALPAILFASLPLARAALLLRRSRRARKGQCQHCGYDLRATPTRCPECGHAPAFPTPKSTEAP